MNIIFTSHTKEISIQTCHFVTAIPVVRIVFNGVPATKILMSHSSFKLNASMPSAAVVHVNIKQISWMLWNTSFQINNDSIISGDLNFTKNTKKIVTLDGGAMFSESILESPYASGNILHNAEFLYELKIKTKSKCRFTIYRNSVTVH